MTTEPRGGGNRAAVADIEGTPMRAPTPIRRMRQAFSMKVDRFADSCLDSDMPRPERYYIAFLFYYIAALVGGRDYCVPLPQYQRGDA